MAARPATRPQDFSVYKPDDELKLHLTECAFQDRADDLVGACAAGCWQLRLSALLRVISAPQHSLRSGSCHSLCLPWGWCPGSCMLRDSVTA